jgi:outer membrane receptor protein involved in Fe transport
LLAWGVSVAHAQGESARDFSLHGASLPDLLQQFSTQSGLQLVYAERTLRGRHASGFSAHIPPVAALGRLLAGTGLKWRQVSSDTIAIFLPEAASTDLDGQVTTPRPAERPHGEVVTILPDLEVRDRMPWAGENRSEAAGSARSLYETPRTVDVVSGQVIEDLSLSAVEDLLVAVPGVFTTTRFGVQGSVDIRGVPADTYFRGMKRLTLQGHARSVLAAMDSIEVVAGPASALYGLGKIGGYTNFMPKSGRARTGRYLEQPEGYLQMIGGRYGRREVSAGVGGPLPGDRDGGYYVYAMREDSDTYTDGVPVRQWVLQASASIDDWLGGMRLETGLNLQESVTAGALMGRFTQALVSDGRYIAGSPLVNLDLNGNGRIGYLEMVQGSPVTGGLTAANQPLNQLFSWPRGPDGQYLPLGQFPLVSGIPAALFDYLTAHPEADPTGQLRAQGVGGPLPQSGIVPIGMALDPRSVRFATLNRRRSPAYENRLQARFVTAYADLIRDADPEDTLRNQFFFDGMDQYKSSEQPYSQLQRVFVIEDKLTAGRRIWPAARHLSANLQLTANIRHTQARGRFTTGDYGNHRSDAASDTWDGSIGGMTPNTTFASANEYPLPEEDGLPWGSIYRTRYTEFGAGLMLDFDFGSRVSALLGARHDISHARNTQYAGRFNFNTGTTQAPGTYFTADESASGWDGGTSLSASVSLELTDNLRPYLTYARATLLLDGNNNSLLNPVIEAGHVGMGSLREAGLRTRWLGGQLGIDAAAFTQGRSDVDISDDVNVLNAYATATTSRGWQIQARYAPGERAYLGAYVIRNVTRYAPNVGGSLQLDARALGFVDIRDEAGNVIYPAEAFLYGGRARIQLPAGMAEYARKQGNPPTQAGLTGLYRVGPGWLASLRAQYLSDTCSGRLCLVHMPEALVLDIGAQFSTRHVDLKLDVFNVGNRRYFRARTGDALGDVIAQAMPGRRWQLTAKYRF